MPKDIKIRNPYVREQDVTRCPGAMDSICSFCIMKDCKMNSITHKTIPIIKCRKYFYRGVSK